MARLFSVDFDFREKVFSAMVLLNDAGNELSIEIKTYDPALKDLIPGGNLSYIGEDGYQFLEGFKDQARELVASIADAIKHHLQKE